MKDKIEHEASNENALEEVIKKKLGSNKGGENKSAIAFFSIVSSMVVIFLLFNQYLNIHLERVVSILIMPLLLYQYLSVSQ